MTLGSMFRRPGTACFACALIAALASPIASGQTRRTDARNPSVDELKVAYLACDRAALTRALSGPEAMDCSVVYEEFKRRAFDGNFDRLLAWHRSQRSSRGSGHAK